MSGAPDRPLIAFGIPAYDAWPTVRRLLGSLRAQVTDAPTEIVLVDDCHPDDLRARTLEDFPEATALRNDVNRGPAHARNRILEAAHAPWVAFFDADCVVPPGWVEAVRPHLDPERLITGRVVRPDGSLEWGPRRATWLGVSVATDVERADVASSNNLVVGVDAARRAGGFNEDLRIYFEDSLFSLQFRRAGGHVSYLAEAEVVHHHHSVNEPARAARQGANTIWAMHHHYRGRPVVQAACALGLCANYALKSLAAVGQGQPRLAGAHLRGAREGLARIAARRPWRERWLIDRDRRREYLCESSRNSRLR